MLVVNIFKSTARRIFLQAHFISVGLYQTCIRNG